LYQVILNKEKHVNQITYITTLAGYIHYLLTGRKVMGIGEASGMFPIDTKLKTFDSVRIKKINQLFNKHHLSIKFNDIFPKVLLAGTEAGTLTKNGALLLDPKGDLKVGVVFCPPEGDAGTGMIATNTIKPKTGNVSAGTSAFGMIVLERNLPK
jgi:sugar (pentulose or hexulose) kinase